MSRYSVASLGRSSIVRTSIGYRPSTLGRSSLLGSKRISTTIGNLATAYNSVSYSGTLSWETAFTDSVGILKIQYRTDSDIIGFLSDPDRVRLLTYSSIARMEYNRRCIREELEFETYSPPRARRIAKEVAIDYIRKWLDGEEEKIEMFKKIQDVERERDSVVAQVIKVEDENLDLKREKDRLMIQNSEVVDEKDIVEADLGRTKDALNDINRNLQETVLRKKDVELTLSNTESALESSKNENSQLREDVSSLKLDLEKARKDNNTLRNECNDAWKTSNNHREEISALKQALEIEKANASRANAQAESLKKQNYDLLSKNSSLNEKNLKLRDETNVYRAREEEMRTLVNIQSSILITKEKEEPKSEATKEE